MGGIRQFLESESAYRPSDLGRTRNVKPTDNATWSAAFGFVINADLLSSKPADAALAAGARSFDDCFSRRSLAWEASVRRAEPFHFLHDTMVKKRAYC